MSRTIGRRHPRDRTYGDFKAACDYCGAAFLRSKLKRLRNGLLACIDNDAIGRDEVELDQLNAAQAAKYRPRYSRDGGRDPDADS